MAQCPSCLAEVMEDFGSTECENCGAQLLIHMDGRIETMPIAEDAEIPQGTSPHSETIYRPTDEPHEDNADFAMNAAGDVDDVDNGDENYIDDELQEAPQHEEEELSKPSEPSFIMDEFESEPLVEKPDIFADPESSSDEEVPQVFTRETSDSPDLSDIAQFGNSETSSGRDGVLRYLLNIQGIDTVDVREAFREALTDRKFLWDTDQILRSIRNGEVQIPNVTASKAYILITRLRTLPVKVKWEQYAVHQP